MGTLNVNFITFNLSHPNRIRNELISSHHIDLLGITETLLSNDDYVCI